ncbi:Cof-type HAD-IIB family hydrolase [Evansella cellulosilytica]|uniref:Cof-like hydrolase n=1 Tax=Evansella cellulosilytica (strain ATCC 21833 / DSM 2522 / FERM P-1141 / JCM 9156 / N-4) TaxID=649639 RepID=E6TR90_EVAC2|nr:Cof-type HAD-IIB family hydrolase [Evansella cellulosilytica]ADU30602.1 Cof-like hydrolase [Evansella cellulosilytica DSM 2522]
MKYSMIVLDLDDTLLLEDLTIGNHTKKALMKAQELGVKVVLASGRPTFAMQHLVKELSLDKYGSYILPFNGAKIINCKTDDSLFSSTLNPKTVHHLYELSQRENVFIHSYIGDTIITDKNNEYTEIEAKITGLPIKEVSSFIDTIQEPVVKVLMCHAPEKLVKVENKLKEELGDSLSIFRSKPYFLEFIEPGVTKGSSLEKLINHLGINRSEIIAVGDSYNDLEMIKFAGLGVAMGNAPEDIKEIADYVTDTNINEGVASVVEKYILNTL